MSLEERMLERQVHRSQSELQGRRVFNIDGITAGAPATMPMSQLVAALPLGKSWIYDPLAQGYSNEGLLVNLLVVAHEVYWISTERAIGTVHYASGRAVLDIDWSWERGAEYLILNQPTQSPYTAETGTAFTNSRTVHSHFPVQTFNYHRIECYSGYFVRGIWFAWSGGRVGGWGRDSSGNANSQRKLVGALSGKLNGTLFLGDSSGTWKCEGAKATLMPVGYDTGGIMGYIDLYDVQYSFSHRPRHAWQWMHPDTGVWHDIYFRGNFDQLDLVWRDFDAGNQLIALGGS